MPFSLTVGITTLRAKKPGLKVTLTFTHPPAAGFHDFGEKLSRPPTNDGRACASSEQAPSLPPASNAVTRTTKFESGMQCRTTPVAVGGSVMPDGPSAA